MSLICNEVPKFVPGIKSVIANQDKKFKTSAPRCEILTHKKLRSHEQQLFMINHRLKPYKKDPPLAFQTARTIFLDGPQFTGSTRRRDRHVPSPKSTSSRLTEEDITTGGNSTQGPTNNNQLNVTDPKSSGSKEKKGSKRSP